MKALVLTQLVDGAPTILSVGENCTGLTRVANVDDYGVFMVAGTAEQIAALAGLALVEDANWAQPISVEVAGALNALLTAGGYPTLPDGISLADGMLAMLGEFAPELYDVGDGVTAERVITKRRKRGKWG